MNIVTRSYIKIYGPPVATALRKLEQVAVDMSKKTTIRHLSTITPSPMTFPMDEDTYGAMLLPHVNLPTSEKVQLISHAAMALGDYDFFFEWEREPTKAQVNELIEMIHAALAECKCMYTITTK